MATSLGREKIITRKDAVTGESWQEKCGFTLFHVAFTGLKRENLKEDFLFTYDGKKAPNLDYAIEHGWTGKKFMDSGEFPAHKKGIRLDPVAYLNYINTYGKYLWCFCCMDYIPRESDGPDWTKISAEVTWRDYCAQREMIKDPEIRDKFIYIIHLEDVASLLPRALEYRDSLGMPIRYLGAGLSISDPDLRLRQGALWNDILTKYKYDGQVHGFGLQSKAVIEQIPILTSSDSSSAVREQASGLLFYKDDRIKIGADTKVSHKGQFTEAQFKAIEPEIRAYAEHLGIDYDLARVDASERFLFNVRSRSEYIKDLDPTVPAIKATGKGLLGMLNKPTEVDWHEKLRYSDKLEDEIRARMSQPALELMKKGFKF